MCEGKNGRYDNLHGDEDEILRDYWQRKEAYEEEHADDWSYDTDEN